jgi:hypothetical protein
MDENRDGWIDEILLCGLGVIGLDVCCCENTRKNYLTHLLTLWSIEYL